MKQANKLLLLLLSLGVSTYLMMGMEGYHDDTNGNRSNISTPTPQEDMQKKLN